MAGYRIFYLDDDGKVFGRDEFQAEDDVAALAQAAKIAATRRDKAERYEVWQGDRRIEVVTNSSDRRA